jgi:hypothetical protein
MIGQYDFHRIYYLDVICIYATIPSSNPLFLLTGHLRSKTLSLNTKGFLDHDRMIISFTPTTSVYDRNVYTFHYHPWRGFLDVTKYH